MCQESCLAGWGAWDNFSFSSSASLTAWELEGESKPTVYRFIQNLSWLLICSSSVFRIIGLCPFCCRCSVFDSHSMLSIPL